MPFAVQVANASQYPADEVERLVALGMASVDTDDVWVNVKNTHRKAYGGRAYCGVPRLSPVRAAYLVTLHLGTPERFPTTNVVQVLRWLPKGTPLPTAEAAAAAKGEALVRLVARAEGRRRPPRYGLVLRQPYGGRGSPLLELADWREALVAVVAHEARHVWQLQHSKPRSEVDAERFAAKRLAEYRAGLEVRRPGRLAATACPEEPAR